MIESRIKASEMIQITSVNAPKADQDEYNKIAASIKVAANKGDNYFLTDNNMRPQVVKALEEDGFKLEYQIGGIKIIWGDMFKWGLYTG